MIRKCLYFQVGTSTAFLSKSATKTSRKLQAIALGCRALHSKVSTGCPQTRPPKGSLFKLTATQIAGLQPGAKARDISDPAVPGLVLRIGPGTSKRWLFRFKLKRKTSRISLGSFPVVSLAQARSAALANRELLEKGIDPRQAQRSHRRKAEGLARRADPRAARDAHSVPTTHASLPCPAPEDKHSVDFLAYEYVERYVRCTSSGG